MILRLGSALMCLAAALLTAPAAAQKRITYCCIGDNGRQMCSDVLPKECYGKAYREVSPRGIVLRHVPAPLTAGERAAREAEEKKAREEEARRLEQDRRNRALLATYTSEKDIDAARDRAVADLQKAIKAARENQAELAMKKQKLDSEAEFYKKNTMPAPLQAQIHTNDTEMKAQQAAIDGKLKEIEAAKARYEDEKRRFLELTKQPAERAGPQPSAGATARPR
ncbi:MAG: hypothetical protein R3E35_05850 [Rhodocyclaceae bacterium]